MTEKEQIFSDDDIVRSVREGKVQNFEILVNRYKSRIVNFIHKMIYDFDEAQSLAQDVFLKVFEKIQNYKEQDNFQAFVFTIAKNLTLNYIKKQKRISFFSGGNYSESMENKYFRCEGTQEAEIEKSEREELLTKALKTLKENQRIALILKVYMQFSYKKIAEVTGWSEPKIETLISRAKSKLSETIRSLENVESPTSGNPPAPPDPNNENCKKNLSRMF